nr:zinc finger, CCHC-type [Tanacetum cinerariifolium]
MQYEQQELREELVQVPPEALAAHAAWVKGQKETAILMLMTMELDIQQNLENLGAYDMLQELKTLFSQQEYDSFVQNYNMHGMGKTVNELHAMLKLHEQTLPKKDAPALHAIRAGKVQKKNNKNKKPQLAARGNNQASSSVEVVSNQPSPFASSKSSKISLFIKGLKYHPYIQEQAAMEINLFTEVKKYLLDRSPNATFTMVSHE